MTPITTSCETRPAPANRNAQSRIPVISDTRGEALPQGTSYGYDLSFSYGYFFGPIVGKADLTSLEYLAAY